MAVGDVDRREVLSSRSDPVHDLARILVGHAGVDQYCVALAADQRDGGCTDRSA
jgi:hypothetical protein